VARNLERVAWVYGVVVGAGLLLEGGALLLINTLGWTPPALGLPLTSNDTRHNLLHVFWGVVLLVLLVASRDYRRANATLLVFGIFYTLLGLLGIVVDNPFGLLLGPGENGFHLLVGPVALALGGWATLVRGRKLRFSEVRQHQPKRLQE